MVSEYINDGALDFRTVESELRKENELLRVCVKELLSCFTYEYQLAMLKEYNLPYDLLD